MFTELPGDLSFATVPPWWTLPLLALSGLLVALCIQYLPGNCGHSPAEGLKTGGSPLPIELPGVALRRWRPSASEQSWARKRR